MSELTVLVTGVGSTTAQSVLKGLNAQDQYETFVVGTDTHAADEIAGTAFCDAFYRIPPATEEAAYVSALRETVRTERVDLLVPIVDPELRVLADNRGEIEKECELLLSSHRTVEICGDKRETARWMEANGVQTPTTVADPTTDDLKRLFEDAPSLIAKPRRGVSSRGVYELHSPADRVLLERIDDPIVQPKLDGTEYTIDVFRTDEHTIAVPRKRVDTRSGISYKGRTVDDEGIAGRATNVADALEIVGPANIQCFETDGELSFFEVNPRFSGSLPLTIEAGLNSPQCALQWAAGDQVTFPDEIREVTMCRFWEEAFHADGETHIPRHLR